MLHYRKEKEVNPVSADNNAKEAIYRDYYGKIFAYVRSHINDRTTAEDITSDVFLKVYEKLDSFDEAKASFSTWIYTVARNTLTDHYRTRHITEEIPEAFAAPSDIEESVCSSEMLKSLAAGLKTLDERERDIIILRFYKGKTLREISASLNISYAYVKVLQNKAFAKLKIYLE